MNVYDASLTVGSGGLTPNVWYATSTYFRYYGQLRAYRNSTDYTGSIFVPLTTPLTSSSWSGNSFSTKAKTLIDLSAVFGAPAGIKAALFVVAIRDSASAANDTWIVLGATNTAGLGMNVDCSGLANDRFERNTIVVPCNANGDVYYQISASGASTLDVYLQIHGYWI